MEFDVLNSILTIVGCKKESFFWIEFILSVYLTHTKHKNESI
jgi:hypothetical protein